MATSRAFWDWTIPEAYTHFQMGSPCSTVQPPLTTMSFFKIGNELMTSPGQSWWLEHSHMSCFKAKLGHHCWLASPCGAPKVLGGLHNPAVMDKSCSMVANCWWWYEYVFMLVSRHTAPLSQPLPNFIAAENLRHNPKQTSQKPFWALGYCWCR